LSETDVGHLDRWITWIVGAMGEMDGSMDGCLRPMGVIPMSETDGCDTNV
jgi:hypothetical protein